MHCLKPILNNVQLKKNNLSKTNKKSTSAILDFLDEYSALLIIFFVKHELSVYMYNALNDAAYFLNFEF